MSPLLNFLCVICIFISLNAIASENIVDRSMISIVSSASMHSLSSIIAEEFGNRSKFRTPIVESSGNGIGFKDFCHNKNNRVIDVIVSSRKINKNELTLCNAFGSNSLKEILVGYDALVFANSKKSEKLSLNSEDLFNAIAESVPISENKEIWIKNNYSYWNEINASLPKKEIEIYAPSFNSPANDTILDTILLKNCLSSSFSSKEEYSERIKKCKRMRSDYHYRVSNDEAKTTIKKLLMNVDSIGLISYSAYLKNKNVIQPVSIDGVLPSNENIIDGKYTLVRPVYFYVKNENLAFVRGLEDFVNFLTNERVVGASGILSQKGLLYGKSKVIDLSTERQ